MKTKIITILLFWFYLHCLTLSAFDPNSLLDSVDHFVIRQASAFNSLRPADQPPIPQTFGWNIDTPYSSNNLIGRPINLPYRGDIYDASVIICYLISRSRTNPNCLDLAQAILDAITFLQSHDMIPDGRTHAAAWCNNLLAPDGQHSSIFAPDIGVGNLAWQGIALTRFYHALPMERKDDKYLNAAILTGQWIVNHCWQGNPNNYPDDPGGFSGGLGGWDYQAATWRGIEHNIDVYTFGRNLFHLTGDQQWMDMAMHAKKFIHAMYDEIQGCYLTGTTSDGTTLNYSPIPADAQSWTILACGDRLDRLEQALDWLLPQGLDPNNPSDLLVEDDVGGRNYKGIMFSNMGQHMQSEITACAAMACYLTDRQEDGDELLENLNLVRLHASPTDDGIADALGIPATPMPMGAPTGFSDATYPNLLHSASSAWTGLAVMVSQGDWMANPLRPLPIPGDFNGDNQVDLLDFVIFSRHWLEAGCVGPYFCNGLDLDQDGFIGFSELNLAATFWLESEDWF